MNDTQKIIESPWDSIALKMPCWQILDYSESTLQQSILLKGHQSIKVDPLASKKLLHDFGFYYTDTLIEPHGQTARLRLSKHPEARVSRDTEMSQLLAICHGAFIHGRFHRDFNIDNKDADQRYDNWLRQLIKSNQIYTLYWQNQISGFIAYQGNSLVLHAVDSKFRGQGLAKYWWSAACADLLSQGHDSICSSISASNLAILNLYASLGFSFKNPKDVYHKKNIA